MKSFNKAAKGIVSLLTIIIVLVSVLASSIYYDRSITGNVVNENPTFQVQIKEIKDINELSQFNEGWYAVKNGLVYYLEGFNSYIPLYVKVLDKRQQNGFVLIEEDSTVIFDADYYKLLENKPHYEVKASDTQQTQNQNQITGAVAGLEKISGLQTATTDTNLPLNPFNLPSPLSPSDRMSFKNFISVSRRIVDDPSSLQQPEASLIQRGAAQIQQQATSAATAATPGGQAAGTTEPGAPTPAPVIHPEEIPTTTIEGQQQLVLIQNTGAANIYKGRDDKVCERGSIGCYEIAPQHSLSCDSSFCRPDPCCVVIDNSIPTARPGGQPALQQAQQETPIRRFINSERKTVVVTHSGNDYIIDIQGQPLITISAALIQNVDFNDVNRDFTGLNNLPSRNGGTIGITMEGSLPTNIVERNNQGITVKETRITQNNDGTRTEISTQNLGGRSTQTETLVGSNGATISRITREKNENDNAFRTVSEIRNLPDGTTRTINYNTATSEENDITNVVYTTKDSSGRSRIMPVNGELYSQIPGANRDRMLTIAAREGFRNPSYEEGALVQGDRSIRTDSISNILLLENNKVRKLFDPYTNTETEYSGDVTYDNARGIVFGRYSTIIGYEMAPNGERRISSRESIRNNNDGSLAERISVNFNPDGSIDYIYTKTPSEESTYRNVRQINDQSQFNGMYAFTGGDCPTSTCYIDGNTIYDSNKAEVTTISEAQRNLLSSGVDQSRRAMGLPTRSQASIRGLFAGAERIFTEFRGLGYYATFFGDDFIAGWREAVDQSFAKYIGVDYWESEICRKWFGTTSEGFVYSETPQGIAQVAAHIEATKTEPINTGTKTEYLYKITFEVKNGGYASDPSAPEEMNVKVQLRKEDGSFVSLYKGANDGAKTVKRGDSWKKAGTEAVVAYSITKYDQVCFEFDHFPSTWRLRENRLCNKIQLSTEEPSALERAQERAQDPQLNDI